jgi:hypothetical protein
LRGSRMTDAWLIGSWSGSGWLVRFTAFLFSAFAIKRLWIVSCFTYWNINLQILLICKYS